jgi:hypothetical protein
MAFDLIKNMWTWFIQDLIGNEMIAVIIIMSIVFMIISSIGIPRKVGVIFMIPLSLSFIFMGYLSWFGWLIIAGAGMIFGTLAYKLYE